MKRSGIENQRVGVDVYKGLLVGRTHLCLSLVFVNVVRLIIDKWSPGRASPRRKAGCPDAMDPTLESDNLMLMQFC